VFLGYRPQKSASLQSFHSCDVNSPLRALTLSKMNKVNNLSHTTLLRSRLMRSHLFLGLPICLFCSSFPIKTLYACLIIPIFYIPRPSIFPQFGEHYTILNTSISNFLQSPLLHPSQVQLSSSGPLSQTPSISFLPLCKKPVTCPYKTNSIFIVLGYFK
jgi:hypothetical protein